VCIKTCPLLSTKTLTGKLCTLDFTINVLVLAWAARHIGPSNDVTALRMDTDPSVDWRAMAIDHAKQVHSAHHLHILIAPAKDRVNLLRTPAKARTGPGAELRPRLARGLRPTRHSVQLPSYPMHTAMMS
jgi:hypothetical protein